MHWFKYEEICERKALNLSKKSFPVPERAAAESAPAAA